jgi:hypothetical protein
MVRGSCCGGSTVAVVAHAADGDGQGGARAGDRRTNSSSARPHDHHEGRPVVERRSDRSQQPGGGGVLFFGTGSPNAMFSTVIWSPRSGSRPTAAATRPAASASRRLARRARPAHPMPSSPFWARAGRRDHGHRDAGDVAARAHGVPHDLAHLVVGRLGAARRPGDRQSSPPAGPAMGSRADPPGSTAPAAGSPRAPATPWASAAPAPPSSVTVRLRTTGSGSHRSSVCSSLSG